MEIVQAGALGRVTVTRLRTHILAAGVGLGMSAALFSIGTYALNSGKAEAAAPKMLEV